MDGCAFSYLCVCPPPHAKPIASDKTDDTRVPPQCQRQKGSINEFPRPVESGRRERGRKCLAACLFSRLLSCKRAVRVYVEQNGLSWLEGGCGERSVRAGLAHNKANWEAAMENARGQSQLCGRKWNEGLGNLFPSVTPLEEGRSVLLGFHFDVVVFFFALCCAVFRSFRVGSIFCRFCRFLHCLLGVGSELLLDMRWREHE